MVAQSLNFDTEFPLTFNERYQIQTTATLITQIKPVKD
jgi:hypothetical protein